jgi:ribosomal protein S6--L-glutamate ligase
MTRIAILSRNRGLHSIRRLLQEARKLGITCDVINPLECQLHVGKDLTKIVVGQNPLPHYDAVLPRIGASITQYGLSVVQQFEVLGSRVVNPTDAIAKSRDKMRCLQILTAAKIAVPETVLARSSRGRRQALQTVGGVPAVLKLLQGTQGVGVMIVNSPLSLNSVLDTFQSIEEDLLLQRFIAEGAGKDYRVFVIGGKVIAAMMRTAPEGEFRSNIHRGGEGKLVKLPKTFEATALKAVRALGLDVAGVDLMAGAHGPLVLEVNSSPGFEGIERATGLNIAALIVKLLHKEAKKAKKKPSKARPRARKRR